jgi:hypothetical protein
MLSVEIVMPPAGSSLGSLKLLIVTPGKPLKALNETTFDNETLSKMVPSAVRRNLLVEIVQSKLGLCNKKVAKSVKLSKTQPFRLDRAVHRRLLTLRDQ